MMYSSNRGCVPFSTRSRKGQRMIRVTVTFMAVPVSGEIRHARASAAHVLGPQLEALRGPLLALVGTGALAFNAVSKRQTPAMGKAECGGRGGISLYSQLTCRGHETLAWLRTQPAMANFLRRADEVFSHLTKSFEDAVDEIHDVAEEALGRLSLLTNEAPDRAVDEINRLVVSALTSIPAGIASHHLAGPSRPLGDTAAVGAPQAVLGARRSKRLRAEQKHPRGQRVGGPDAKALAEWARRSATRETPRLARIASGCSAA